MLVSTNHVIITVYASVDLVTTSSANVHMDSKVNDVKSWATLEDSTQDSTQDSTEDSTQDLRQDLTRTSTENSNDTVDYISYNDERTSIISILMDNDLSHTRNGKQIIHDHAKNEIKNTCSLHYWQFLLFLKLFKNILIL